MEKEKLIKCSYGISSKADDLHGHVLIFDYDDKKLKDVVEHLRNLQNEFSLSDIYIIKSTHGYNALCLDIMPISLIYNIGIRVESICDRMFFKAGLDRGYYTLRFDDDKKLVEILKSNNNVYKKSFVHKCFLEWFFNIKIDYDNTFNDYKKLKIIQFPSDKNGYHLVEKIIPSYRQRGI